jgi:hypothetical protein
MHINVKNRFGSCKLPIFHDMRERNVIPVFKSPVDATRFERDVLSQGTMRSWRIEDTYPIDVNMNYLSMVSLLETSVCTKDANCTPLDLDDMDTVLSLSVLAHYGFFVVGTFDVTRGEVSINGVLVDANLQSVGEDEHVHMLKRVYEKIYIGN